MCMCVCVCAFQRFPSILAFFLLFISFPHFLSSSLDFVFLVFLSSSFRPLTRTITMLFVGWLSSWNICARNFIFRARKQHRELAENVFIILFYTFIVCVLPVGSHIHTFYKAYALHTHAHTFWKKHRWSSLVFCPLHSNRYVHVYFSVSQHGENKWIQASTYSRLFGRMCSTFFPLLSFSNSLFTLFVSSSSSSIGLWCHSKYWMIEHAGKIRGSYELNQRKKMNT